MSATATAEITEPGIYELPAEIYHGDPVPGGSLSSTGARKILPPSCPARFRWEADHPEPPSAVFDIGTAAHALVLGAGAPIVAIEADSWRTNAAKDAAAEARADGSTPLLRAEFDMVHTMADAIRSHPIASRLFAPEHGAPEQSLFWRDDEFGIWKRGRFDWLPEIATGSRPVIPDYKTARSADPRQFAASAARYGYHAQAAWYLDGLSALTGVKGAFVFVVQEKEPPYLASVVELDFQALRDGRLRNQRASEIYASCKESGEWPGYADDIALVSLPGWAAFELEGALA